MAAICRVACQAGLAAGTAAPSTPPAPQAPPLSAQVQGDSLALHLTGTFTAAPHALRLSYFNVLNSAPLGSGTFQAVATQAGVLDFTAALKAAPGVYRLEAELDGASFPSTQVYVPGVERNGGDLSVDGQPFSGFAWTWRPIDYVFKKGGGRFTNINVANMLRPVSAGGFGFNCVFMDSLWPLKVKDFAYLDQVAGHICIGTCTGEGLNPWGPVEWNSGIKHDPIILSDGTPARGGSFDSPRNRENFVRDLKLFKAAYGSPRALLGFYMFESTSDMPWDNRGLYSDYSPASKERFRQWLATRFGSVAQFNAKRGARLASFAGAEPPASPDDVTARGMDPGYWNDWIDFRYWDMADFLAWARSQIKTIFGQEKMLFTIEGLTSSYSSNDSNVAGANSEYGIDERLRARATDAIGVEGTYDYMPNHVRILRRATDFNGDGLPDIPIVMDYYNYSWQPAEMYADPPDIPRLRFVDELGEGATGGMLEDSGEVLVRWEENSPHVTESMLDGFRQVGAINDIRSRYPGLFAQARVPYDISIVIPVWQLHYDARLAREAPLAERTDAAFQHALQRSQREIRMLYADEPLPADARALVVPTGERISKDFIARLETVVKAGAKVYLEGDPVMDETGHPIPFPLEDLVGAGVAEESGTDITSMDGATLHCRKPRKLEQIEGDVVARFSDGAPAVVRHRYFNGEVIYCPSLVGCVGAGEGWHNAMFETNFPEAYRAYYAAIAGMLSDPIMRVSGAHAPAELRLHLLAGVQTQLLLVTNWSPDPQDFQVRLGFTAGIAADLRAGKPLPVGGGMGRTVLQLHMGGRDWAAIALAATPSAMQAGLRNPKASFALEAPGQKP